MPCHRFSNLGQAFQGDLNGKLIKNIRLEDYANLECNCNITSKVNGTCAFGGDCWKSVVVYKVECKDCGMCYLGNTQQKLKRITHQHLGEVCKLVNTCKASDSFAKHFAIHQKQQTTKLNIRKVRTKVKVSILWKGNSISCNKSFGKLNCSLRMKVRILILKHPSENPNIVINSNLEFYGACRHKPKFHRYATTTDQSPERIEYNHANPQNTDTNSCTYMLEEQFAAMNINPLAHITKHQQGLREIIQVNV